MDPELVDQKLRDLIASHHGAVRHSVAMITLSPRQRAALPIVLSSGDFDVRDENPGGVTIRLREKG